MKPNVTSTPDFEAALKKLPPNRQNDVIRALSKFRETMTWPSLRFRQLKGRPGFFIISANRGDRVILRQDVVNTFALIDVGPHDNVYRRWDQTRR